MSLVGVPGDQLIDARRPGEISHQPGSRRLAPGWGGLVLPGVGQVREHRGQPPGAPFPDRPGGDQESQIILVDAPAGGRVVQRLEQENIRLIHILAEADARFGIGEPVVDVLQIGQVIFRGEVGETLVELFYDPAGQAGTRPAACNDQPAWVGSSHPDRIRRLWIQILHTFASPVLSLPYHYILQTAGLETGRVPLPA